MSFSKTLEQMRDRSKTVTRRGSASGGGWRFLKPGDRLRAVEKAMGLKKGEKVQAIGVIEVVSVREEPLGAIEQADCVAEGFPDLSPAEFVAMYRSFAGGPADQLVTRIEFKHVDGGAF